MWSRETACTVCEIANIGIHKAKRDTLGLWPGAVQQMLRARETLLVPQFQAR